jgi:hypothetical protein
MIHVHVVAAKNIKSAVENSVENIGWDLNLEQHLKKLRRLVR